jgi:hypothetical protein
MQTATVSTIATTDCITTQEAARRLFVKPATLRFSLCTKGHYFGLRPRKLPSGRLLWPADQVDRLRSGEPIEAIQTAAQRA